MHRNGQAYGSTTEGIRITELSFNRFLMKIPSSAIEDTFNYLTKIPSSGDEGIFVKLYADIYQSRCLIFRHSCLKIRHL